MCLRNFFLCESPSYRLWDAVYKNNYPKAEKLLAKSNININYMPHANKNSILHIAVHNNNLPMIKLLFESQYGKHINIQMPGEFYKGTQVIFVRQPYRLCAETWL